jgi:hypothetical protein
MGLLSISKVLYLSKLILFKINYSYWNLFLVFIIWYTQSLIMKQITQKEDSYNSSMYKNSWTIAISNNITLLQRKLFNFLVGHAYIDLAHKEIYEIPISGLKNRLWFNSSNNKYLQESLKKLITTAVEFNLLCKDKDDWEASALLSSVKFRSWICYYSFSPILREKLHKPNVYSKLNLNLIKLFSSKYSLCLYEI